MFEHLNLSKSAFLIRNAERIDTMIAQVNAGLTGQYGAQLQPLTKHDFWLVFIAEAAIDSRGHIDVDGRHSNGERGVLPLPSNVRFWNGPSAPDPRQPHTLEVNMTQYALYLGQLKNKVVRQRGGRDVYPGLFRHPGISANPTRMAKLLAGVVHGYFFSGNYSTGTTPDDTLLTGYANDDPVADMLRGTTYVYAGRSILDNRQRNIDAAIDLIAQHESQDGSGTFADSGNDDGLYALTQIHPSEFDNGALRLDVDGSSATGHFSVEIAKGFPRQTTHVIGRIVRDTRTGAARVIEAIPIYQRGTQWLAQTDALRLELVGGGDVRFQVRRGGVVISDLSFLRESSYFDRVEFEVDVVDNAGHIVDLYDTNSHPNRPSGMPASAISIERAFEDAGFDVTMSSARSVVPIQESGLDSPWSNMELHNAMQKFWSSYDDRAQWGMWVIYAALHDRGSNLGGIMFDTLGNRHRQGTAIFTNSFIANPPAGETHPDAWRNRMQLWTAVHEIGHGFNLTHSWEKSLGMPFPYSAQNEPEARSFMNYPDKVHGRQAAFFSDFEFRFSQNELLFMRHAPRDFVRMGGSAWGVNHGFETVLEQPGQPFRLELRPNRDSILFAFMEPVHLELKLTNIRSEPQAVPIDVLEEGHHVAFAVAPDRADNARRHRPFKTACFAHVTKDVAPGQSLYATHFVGASVGGWLIDEPGFYTIQAAVSVGAETIHSNLLRIYVSPDIAPEAHRLAPDFFGEEVARVLAFQGAPELSKANDTLREVVERLPQAAVSKHARLGLASPKVRAFKSLVASDEDGARLKVQLDEADLDGAMELETSLLRENADATAETLGHIQYRASIERLAFSLAEAEDFERAAMIQEGLVATLKHRDVLPSVVQDCRSTLRIYQSARSGGKARGKKRAAPRRKAR